MILLTLLVTILLVCLVLSVALLWGSAMIVRAPKANLVRALVATLILTAIGIGYGPAAAWLGREMMRDGDPSVPWIPHAILAFLFLFASWVVLMRVFDTTLPRAIAIWLMNLVPAVVVFPLIFFPLKLFVMEAFTVPTNGMAPTIFGWHHETTCPRCQGTLIFSAPEPNSDMPPFHGERPGICAACRKMSLQAPEKLMVHGPDRILVSKLHTPERWDVIVFRYPPEPTKKYVKRLIGLPGEKVYVKGVSVWINDVKQDVPAELAGLEYTSDMDGFGDLRGTEENPVHLGANEFFVLGDFSKSSSDSRFWGPVPGDNIEGVVCLRYWPMQRCKILR